jgi:hypothetical protein
MLHLNQKIKKMKARITLLLLCIIFASSCVVKSIQPFYIKKQLTFHAALLGDWQDQSQAQWKILSFKDQWEKDNQEDSLKISLEDIKAYDNYREGYVISYTKYEKEAQFIGMPFMVDDYLFIDMTLLGYEAGEINELAVQHLLKTHSVAYIELNTDKSITLRWLTESVINRIIQEGKVRLKHEVTGVGEDLILTASSEELHQFLRTFMATEMEDKWNSDDTYSLKPVKAKP